MFISSDDEEGPKTPSKQSEDEVEDIQIDPKQIELEEAKFIEE